jgi:hypothetical protein
MALDGVTLAYKVTAWPEFAGFGEADRPVALDPSPTASGIAGDVLGLKVPSPLYAAVSE